MAYPKYYTYTRWEVDGSISTVRVPVIWSPEEVARKHRHSVMFLHVPKGGSVVVANRGSLLQPPADVVHGPAVVMIWEDEKMYQVPRAPKDDAEAMSFYTDLERSGHFRKGVAV